MQHDGSSNMEDDAQRMNDLKALFADYYAQLCFFAAKILADQQEAEDVVMEVFSKLWQKDVAADQMRNASSYLYASVRNACLDIIRKKQRLNKLPFIQTEEETIMTEVLEAEEIYAKTLKIVYQHIEELPPQCKTVFKKLFIDGMTTQQVADELKLSVQSVRNQKTRALSILKLKIDPRLLSLILMEIFVRKLGS